MPNGERLLSNDFDGGSVKERKDARREVYGIPDACLRPPALRKQDAYSAAIKGFLGPKRRIIFKMMKWLASLSGEGPQKEPATTLKTTKLQTDKLIGIAVKYDKRPWPEHLQGSLAVESCDSGWWYRAPLTITDVGP